MFPHVGRGNLARECHLRAEAEFLRLALQQFPQFPAMETYPDLLARIRALR